MDVSRFVIVYDIMSNAHNCLAQPPVVLTSSHNGVFTITMNRPSRYNAFNIEVRSRRVLFTRSL